MRFLDIIRTCFRNLTKRKARTLLTVSGVIIGTCAIIVMISLGIGMTDAQTALLSEWADLTLIQVYNWGQVSEVTGTKPADMTDDVVRGFEEIEHVRAATPIFNVFQSGSQLAVYSGDYAVQYVPIVGVYMDSFSLFGYELADGRWKTKQDGPGTVLFCTQTLANLYNFFDEEYIWGEYDEYGNLISTILDPLKDQFSVIPLTFDPYNWETDYSVIGSPSAPNMDYQVDLNVVGVIQGNWSNYYTMTGIFMDISEINEYIKAYNELNPDNEYTEFKGVYNEVYIRVDDMNHVAEVEKKLQEMGYQTYSENQTRENMARQTMMIQMILGALAAVSLFVAALNITNTMIMAIIERTKEIGIMKVLGCDVSKIRMLFLGEAALIGFIGGIVGIVLSYILSIVLNQFLAQTLMDLLGGGAGTVLPEGVSISVIPPWLALGALLFATVIGVVSGFYPANRSVRISALSAIAHD